MSKSEVVIGSGASIPGDSLSPALDLAASGKVQFLVFDRLGETTIAKWKADLSENAETGYDRQIREIAQRFHPHLANGVRLIGSFGGANIDSAVRDAAEGFRSVGGAGTRIGIVRGDDVMAQVLKENSFLPGLNCSARDLGDSLISANAYIGAEPITAALDGGAQLVIGGRISDASQAVGAACHALGWEADYWDGIALSTLVGHLLTSGPAITGGGFADPPYRSVPGLHDLGFAMATLRRGEFILSKLPDGGGMISRDIVKSRIGYEVHDPASYLTPDVCADFSQAALEQERDDEVKVTGISGRPRPPTYRVLVGIDQGWVGVGEISFGGSGCLDRARLGEDIARKRLEPLMAEIDELRFDYYGYSGLFGSQLSDAVTPLDVRLRVAARAKKREVAQAVADAGTYLYWSAAGGAAMRSDVSKAIRITDTFMPRSSVALEAEVVEA